MSKKSRSNPKPGAKAPLPAPAHSPAPAPAPAPVASKPPAPKPPAPPTHEQIARAAHDLWVEKGRPAGRDIEIWCEAERRLARKV